MPTVPPPRAAIRKTVIAPSLTVATVFAIVTVVAKQTPAVFAHQPWNTDPYDVFVSLDLMALPVLLALAAVRLWCARDEAPGPTRRLVDLLRLSTILDVLIGATLATQWAATAMRPPRHDATASAQVVGLGVFTVVIVATAYHRRVRTRALDRATVPAQPDFLADLTTVAGRVTGPAGRRMTTRLSTAVRRHPVGWIVVVAIVAALAEGGSQAVQEGYGVAFAAWFLTVSAASYIGFGLVAGRWLGVVEPSGQRSRTVSAVALGSLGALAAAVSRNDLWWVIGRTTANGGLASLTALTVLGAAAGVLVGLTWHRSAPTCSV